MKMPSLQHELETKGYLSLVKFTKYLKEHHPEACVSYPTALKLVAEGKVRAIRIGSMYRITHVEVRRWVTHGNWEDEFPCPPFVE